MNGKLHLRDEFSCEHESLTNYITRYAGQDSKKDLARCFVLVDEHNRVKGYYTLSTASIHRSEIPEKYKSKIPDGYSIPAVLIGRLARDLSMKGPGCGQALMINAFIRIADLTQNIGAMAVIVDPIDEIAVSFYSKYGFEKLDSGKMFIPMSMVRKLVG